MKCKVGTITSLKKDLNEKKPYRIVLKNLIFTKIMRLKVVYYSSPHTAGD